MTTEQQELTVLLDLLAKAILTCRNIERNCFADRFVIIGTRILRMRLVSIQGHVQKMLGWVNGERS